MSSSSADSALVPMNWALALLGACLGGLVQGLAGFGFGLVSLALLAFAFDAKAAIAIVTMLAFAYTLVGALLLRRRLERAALAWLAAGTVLGIPLGVWLLAVAPSALFGRLIGVSLVGVVLLEWKSERLRRTARHDWALLAGVLSGVLGASVHAAGPPVVLYAASRGWDRETAKGNLQAFFVLNQGAILVGYLWAGLVTRPLLAEAALLAVPASLGFALGWALFRRVDERRFRALVFGFLLVSGIALIVGR